jgi:hypothetical protein
VNGKTPRLCRRRRRVPGHVVLASATTPAVQPESLVRRPRRMGISGSHSHRERPQPSIVAAAAGATWPDEGAAALHASDPSWSTTPIVANDRAAVGVAAVRYQYLVDEMDILR